MRAVLVDTNVILDIALKRQTYFDDALALLDLVDTGKITGHVSATTVTDIYYLVQRDLGRKKALAFISDMTEVLGIAGVDREMILNALRSGMDDFEDAVQAAVASAHNLDAVITRNKGILTGQGWPCSPRRSSCTRCRDERSRV